MSCRILCLLNNLINWLSNHCLNPDPSLPLFPTHLPASSLYHYKASFKAQVWSWWATAQTPSEGLLCSQIMSEPFGMADVVLQDHLLYMPQSPKLLGIAITHHVFSRPPNLPHVLILPGKSWVLYLPGRLLHEFRIQIFCQHSLIWAHLSDGIYARWDHCLLTPLSLTLNCGLIEVRNHAWFSSLPASGKGPGISGHSNTCWTHLFTHSTNVCWASISCPLF